MPEKLRTDGPTLPYNGYVDSVKKVIDFSQDKIVSLIYFCSVGGREDKAKFEWRYSPIDIAETYAALADKLKQYSVGRAVFAISFPPITKIVGWEIEKKESNLQLVEFLDTASIEPIPRNESEIGCVLENLIFAEETKWWLLTGMIDDYFSVDRDVGLRANLWHPNKLYQQENRE